ncbi:two-component system sensor histidine kinase MtrB [Virgisporangium ochraceum]|uniref:Sensor histidine kinase MtrB n=2 Tax=Virgisporangium ochraceum TaxID=65505 RepID=A0A8J3ZTI7_9ACTN|nr:MtrAB system histidine kinase MtrB [Virgisporangium ochraceum]GIJ69391.1 two-component sensor histidine kinase [Virgisporangium ochraceum]
MLRIDPLSAPERPRSLRSRMRGSPVLTARWWRIQWRRVRRAGPGRWLYRVWLTAHQAWRRSLQLRVVSITLVLSSVLIAAFGVLVTNWITNGQLAQTRDETRNTVNQGSQYAISQLRVDGPNDPALASTVPELLAQLLNDAGGSAGSSSGSDSGVQVAIVPVNGRPMVEALAVPGEDRALQALSEPGPLDGLHRLVAEGKTARQYVTADPDGRGSRPFLAYGTLIRTQAGELGLYYMFPLDREVDLAELVGTSVSLTGISLVVLLALLAAVVTRMVVSPVRLAARTAQRLSAGLLDQRMEVRGEDDLASLAAAFNQMAANLQRQILRLEEMSRLQRRFTSDVSHELRTPLTTVRMAADLIYNERDEFDPAVARSAELLHAELDRFEELLTDLLEISRFDAGFAILDAEPVDLTPVVRRVAERLESLAERVGSPIVLEVPDQPVIAEVDQRRVERVLRNLMGNAVEHGEHRPVRVALAADDHSVAITVRDEGIGLKPGEEKLVFNRFWRADPSRARQTGGTGLGLSISLEDARLHGGWLEAWGAPGQGAQFRLVVPLHAGDRLTSSPLPLVPEGAVPTVGLLKEDHAVEPEVIEIGGGRAE